MGTGVKVPVPYERRKLMLEFDRATKTLIAHKLPRRVKSTVYEENDMYTSYRDYLKNDLKQDIEDYVIAGLNEVKGVDIFGLGDVQVVESEDSTSTCKSYDVMLSLRSKGFELVGLGTEIGEPFRVMRLPYIDKSGILYHYNKRYAIIRKLVQADDITFDGLNLKMMTKDGYFVSMARAGSEPRFESSKKAYSCIDVFAALADNEENSGDLLNLIMSMRSERINKVLGINRWSVDKYKCGRLQYNSGGDDILNFVSKLEMSGYSLKKVRPKFNEAVSLDRALGETLASDVDLPQLSMKLRRGQVITEDMLRLLKACGISTIYVKNLPNVTGYYTASLIPIGYIPKGTEMIPELAELIPGWTGLYMNKDYVFDELQKIPLGTLITESFLEAITCSNPCCVKCYGNYLGTRKEVVVGTPVGFEAATSIGEPGTQLTMKNFQSGGIAGQKNLTSSYATLEGYLHIKDLADDAKNNTNYVYNHDWISNVSGYVKTIGCGDGTVRLMIVDEHGDKLRTPKIKYPENKKLKDCVHKGESILQVQEDYSIPEVIRERGVDEGVRYLTLFLYNLFNKEVEVNLKHFEVLISGMVMYVCTKGNDYFKTGHYYSNIEYNNHNREGCKFYKRLLGLKSVPLLRDDVFAGLEFENIGEGLIRSLHYSGKDEMKLPLVRYMFGLKENFGSVYPNYISERCK